MTYEEVLHIYAERKYNRKLKSARLEFDWNEGHVYSSWTYESATFNFDLEAVAADGTRLPPIELCDVGFATVVGELVAIAQETDVITEDWFGEP